MNNKELVENIRHFAELLKADSWQAKTLRASAQEIESLTAENERLRKALEMAGKRLYKEGAPHSYVDDVEAVLNGIEVEYYD